MNCPCCNVPLVMSERQGVEIDYCPQCRGVWLDRGELDKIIERSSAMDAPMSINTKHAFSGHKHDDHYKYHKKKSWLNELFD